MRHYFLYLTVFITGAAVLVVEILGTRLVSPFYGGTIFVWTSLITVTLGALALGYWIGGYWADRKPKEDHLYSIVALVLSMGAFAVKAIIVTGLGVNSPEITNEVPTDF